MSAPPTDPSLTFWRTRHWWRLVVGSAGGLWVSVGLGFIATVLVARSLGPDRYGGVALATAVVATVTALLDVPLGDALVHYGYRAKAVGAHRSLRKIIRRGLIADAAVGATVAMLLLAMATAIAQIASGGWLDPVLLQLAALEGLARTIDGTTGAALLIAARPDLRSWTMALASGFRLGLVGPTAVVVGTPRAVLAAAIIATALSSMIQAAVAWRIAWRRWPGDTERKDLEVGTTTLLRFGVQAGFATTISGARSGLVPVLLARLSGPGAVAFLDVATFPLQAADTASAPVRMALFPEQARLSAEARIGELRGTVRAYVRAALVIGVPGAIVGWLILPWLVPALYTTSYAPAIWPARILTIAALISLTIGWAKSLPAAIGRPSIRTAVLAADAIFVIGVLVLVGERGAAGAALALAAGAAAQGLAWIWLTPHLLRSPPQRRSLANGAAAEGGEDFKP
jgi:O-antigen/teichoic acid export membrane protein